MEGSPDPCGEGPGIRAGVPVAGGPKVLVERRHTPEGVESAPGGRAPGGRLEGAEPGSGPGPREATRGCQSVSGNDAGGERVSGTRRSPGLVVG
jgi:hypothetical protein